MSFAGKASKIASVILLLVGVGSMLGGAALLLQGVLLTGVFLFMIGVLMLVLLVRLAQFIAQQQVAQQAAQQAAQMGQPQQGQIVVVAYPPKQPDTSEPITYCPKCGSQVRERSNFCPKCGENLRRTTRMYGR
jgi:predicted lipid-binding transport protein (Tim44 family)